MNFNAASFLLALIPVIFSLVNYATLRDMIYGILLGNHKKKSADKIVSEQSFLQKFTQRYVGSHITRYQEAYSKWINVKLGHFIFSIVQIAFMVLVSLLNPLAFGIVAIICGVLVIYNIVLYALMMRHTATSSLKKTTKGSPWTFEQ